MKRLPVLPTALAVALVGTLASGAAVAATASNIINLDGKLESSSCIASFSSDVVAFDDYVLGSNADDTSSGAWSAGGSTKTADSKTVNFTVSCPNGGTNVMLKPPTGDGDATLQPNGYFEDSNGVRIGFVVRYGRYLGASPATSNTYTTPGGYALFINRYTSLFFSDGNASSGSGGTKGMEFKPGESYTNPLWVTIGRNGAKAVGDFSHTFTFELTY